MRFRVFFVVILSLTLNCFGQKPATSQGIERRIRTYVDSLGVIDTHEHLIDPELVKKSFFLDFSLLFQQNGYDDLVSSGMPPSYYDKLFNDTLSPSLKWKLIEPYWNLGFNTSFNRIIINSIRDLYGMNGLNTNTVEPVSEKIKKAYGSEWFDKILRDSCKIKYVIKDGENIPGKDEWIRYAKRFDSWLTIRSKYRLDSLAILQLDPIFTLDDLAKSLETAFTKEVKNGMTVVKVFAAYNRSLDFRHTAADDARKIFKRLVNGEETEMLTYAEAKPLQDYMFYKLLDLISKYKVPVAFHTGIQAERQNNFENSNPVLLIEAIKAYPDVNFVLYHGSYPFGGELSALAKNFSNVYIDMNWMYSISPEYSKRYLSEWIETVPAGRMIAFGGDCMAAENVYSELKIARKIISDVLFRKVLDGYFSESEAKKVARMILYDNAVRLYNLN